MKKILIFAVVFSFISCNSGFSEKEKQEYTEKGKEITQATFKGLSTQLMAQMKAGGPAKAVPFCNVEAIPITQEFSEKYNVEIKRTSDKLRNQNNEPSVRELEIINTYQDLLADGEELQPVVERDATNKKHFYAPIVMKANCLVCHGKLNETLTVKTDSIIKISYPFDKATGYSEGDLRGIWSLTFNN